MKKFIVIEHGRRFFIAKMLIGGAYITVAECKIRATAEAIAKSCENDTAPYDYGVPFEGIGAKI